MEETEKRMSAGSVSEESLVDAFQHLVIPEGFL